MRIITKGFIAAGLWLLLLGVIFVGRGQAEAPFINIAAPINGTLFEIQSDVTISGNTVPNSDIILSTADGEYAKLRSDANGAWTYTIPTVTEGSHTIMATVKVPIDSLSTATASANVTYVVGQTNPKEDGKLAETGLVLLLIAVPLGLLLLTVTAYTYVDYRHHRRPLLAADPHVNYSFWHHLHVVSLPLLRYRLSINVDRRLPSKSDQIRRY